VQSFYAFEKVRKFSSSDHVNNVNVASVESSKLNVVARHNPDFRSIDSSFE
jgi:hypothetical protein